MKIANEETTIFARKRLVDDVVLHLRTMIIDGDLPPGQTLLQIDLAERLGISRTPLREAFRILQYEGWVRVTNGNKTLEVIDMTSEELLEIYRMREVVDGLAARLAAERGITTAEVTELEKMLDTMHSFDGDSLQTGRRSAAHAAFHARLAELSGNRYLVAQIPMILMSSQVLARRLAELKRQDTAIVAELLERGREDHRGVIQAITDQDGDLAEQIARRHIGRTIDSDLIQASTQPSTNSARAANGPGQPSHPDHQ